MKCCILKESCVGPFIVWSCFFFVLPFFCFVFILLLYTFLLHYYLCSYSCYLICNCGFVNLFVNIIYILSYYCALIKYDNSRSVHDTLRSQLSRSHNNLLISTSDANREYEAEEEMISFEGLLKKNETNQCYKEVGQRAAGCSAVDCFNCFYCSL